MIILKIEKRDYVRLKQNGGCGHYKFEMYFWNKTMSPTGGWVRRALWQTPSAVHPTSNIFLYSTSATYPVSTSTISPVPPCLLYVQHLNISYITKIHSSSIPFFPFHRFFFLFIFPANDRDKWILERKTSLASGPGMGCDCLTLLWKWNYF